MKWKCKCKIWKLWNKVVIWPHATTANRYHVTWASTTVMDVLIGHGPAYEQAKGLINLTELTRTAAQAVHETLVPGSWRDDKASDLISGSRCFVWCRRAEW